jgi:hypothetical protein
MTANPEVTRFWCITWALSVGRQSEQNRTRLCPFSVTRAQLVFCLQFLPGFYGFIVGQPTNRWNQNSNCQ